MNTDTIEIAIAADAGYFNGLAVAAASIALAASQDVRLSFNFLDGGMDCDLFAAFSARLEKMHPFVSLRRFKIDASRFATFPDWRGNKMAYARFLLPELLPAARHCIYCDADFLWLADIAELWRERDDAVILQAVRDPQIYAVPENGEWFRARGLPYDAGRYFCSGLLMMNLGLFRKEGTVEKLYRFISANQDAMFPDQDALNHILGGGRDS